MKLATFSCNAVAHSTLLACSTFNSAMAKVSVSIPSSRDFIEVRVTEKRDGLIYFGLDCFELQLKDIGNFPRLK